MPAPAVIDAGSEPLTQTREPTKQALDGDGEITVPVPNANTYT